MPAPVMTSIPTSLNWDKQPAPLKQLGKKSNPLIFIAGAATVVLCISGTWRAMHQTAPQEWIKVVGAADDVPAGTKLAFVSLRYVSVPKRFAGKDMSTSLSDVAGHMAKTFIPKGEPIKADMVFLNRNGFSYNLETHERAITIELPDDALVDHEIVPDDRVDVLVVSTKGESKYTKTICQNVRVLLSVPKEQMQARKSGGNNRITLATTADAAEALTEAAEVGKIRLVLRNKLSIVAQDLPGAQPDDLLPASAFEQPPAIAGSSRGDKPVSISVPTEVQPPPALKLIADAGQSSVAQVLKPIEWVVEMISGNKKETCSVPAL